MLIAISSTYTSLFWCHRTLCQVALEDWQFQLTQVISSVSSTMDRMFIVSPQTGRQTQSTRRWLFDRNDKNWRGKDDFNYLKKTYISFQLWDNKHSHVNMCLLIVSVEVNTCTIVVTISLPYTKPLVDQRWTNLCHPLSYLWNQWLAQSWNQWLAV